MAELMTLDEVASYLRVTKKTIYRMIEKRAIPAQKVGHLWRFESKTIDAWLQLNSTEKKADILIIDDDPTICALFRDTLEDSGYAFYTEDDPSKGLQLMKIRDWDLCFLDLKMPGIDGVGILREIRIIRPNLPITIITGYPESDLMANALDYGPLGFMKKPFSSTDILIAVGHHLRFGKMVK